MCWYANKRVNGKSRSRSREKAQTARNISHMETHWMHISYTERRRAHPLMHSTSEWESTLWCFLRWKRFECNCMVIGGRCDVVPIDFFLLYVHKNAILSVQRSFRSSAYLCRNVASIKFQFCLCLHLYIFVWNIARIKLCTRNKSYKAENIAFEAITMTIGCVVWGKGLKIVYTRQWYFIFR